MKKTTAYTTVLIAAMLLLGSSVLAHLCVGAVRTEKEAARLTEAVVWASTAADGFYSADDAAGLALLLDGAVEGSSVVCTRDELTLCVMLAQAGKMDTADITVAADGETVYTLLCRKAPIREGTT